MQQATVTARPAYQDTDHYRAAVALLQCVRELDRQAMHGIIGRRQAYNAAEKYMAQAQDISWAAYADGRGYAATTRLTGKAFNLAWNVQRAGQDLPSKTITPAQQRAARGQ